MNFVKLTSLFALLALAACGTSDDSEPVGIGRGRDEYKKSPCACMTIQQIAPDDAWRSHMREWMNEHNPSA